MASSKIVKEIGTYKAGEDLLKYRRVKIESGTTTEPPEVVYADAGEQAIGVVERDASDGEFVAIRFTSWGGTLEGYAADTFSEGATLYAAADGKISDTSSGSAIGVAHAAATSAGDIIEYLPFGVLSTTAGTVSYADVSGFTTAATTEDALDENYQHMLSAQHCIGIPLTTVVEGDASNVVGYLGPATTPVLDMLNGDTDSALSITWAASDNTPVLVQAILPPNIDVTADLVLHLRGKMGGATDTPVIALDTYFNEGDTKVEDSTTAFGATYAEETATIGAGDVPAGAQTVTIELTPGAHTTDTLIVTAIWLEYTGSLLTS